MQVYKNHFSKAYNSSCMTLCFSNHKIRELEVMSVKPLQRSRVLVDFHSGFRMIKGYVIYSHSGV